MNSIRDKLSRFFYGRQGLDQLSKSMLISGLLLIVLSILLKSAGFLCTLVRIFGLFSAGVAVFRALSKDRAKREAENQAYLAAMEKKRREKQAAKDRRSQKDYKFFKCPGCGTWLRVPKGKGKIHIQCRCGYTLYRKT